MLERDFSVMILILGSFVLCSTLIFLLVYLEAHHSRFSADHDLEGVQKFHLHPVPRVGGLPIFLSLLFAALWFIKDGPWFFTLLLLSLPVFLSGTIEDLTKKISPRVRLGCAMFSAVLAVYILGFKLDGLGLKWLDSLFATVPLFFIVITVVAVAGITNAINIIDGYHGLASMVSIISALAFAFLAWMLGDDVLLRISFVFAASLLGFFVWNFPKGKIFLGDGGAYLIGFILAELALYVHIKHGVSPWFGLMLVAYPVVEVLFSIWRRKIIHQNPVGLPDSGHLHQMVYKRLVSVENFKKRNAYTSPFLWVLHLVPVLTAMVFWNNELTLQCFFVGFIVLYCICYRSIVRFQAAWIRKIFFFISRN